MHSRVKGKGILVQPENNVQIGGPWVPSTPGNPTMPRSNGISIQRNGNQIGRRDWSEFLEIMNKRSQQMSNFDPTGLMNQSISSYNLGGHTAENRSLSNNVGSHTQTQTFHNDIPCWTNTHLGEFSVGNNSVVPVASTTRTLTWNAIQKSTIPASGTPPMLIPEMDPLRTPAFLNLNMQPENIPTVVSSNMHSTTAPAILDSYSEIDSSWMEGNFTRLLLGGENPSLGSNNHWINVDSSPPIPRGGFPVPLLPQYNLNSPPRCEADAASSNTNSFLFAPVTPDHRKLFEKQSHAEMLNFLVDEGSCQGQDKMENLFSCIANEAIESHCNELLQTIVDSSSAAISTPLTENKCVEERGDQEIDLNETPKQKTPKRRKHRPRVVIEGKPKRTPKPKTPKNTNSEEKKRKYVRKKKNPEVENTEAPQTDVINSVKVPSFESQEKSCRKRLHFDIEKTEGEIQDKAATFQMEIHQENRAMLNIDLNSQAGSTRNLNDSKQLPVESLPGEKWNASNAPSGTINNTTLNIIARNVSMRNGSLYQKSEMNSNSREHLHLQGELNNNVSRTNSDIHLEKTRDMRWKSTHQMVERDVGNFKGFCGSKREYMHSMEQAGLSATHKIGSAFMCQEKCQLGNQETLSPNVGTLTTETQKKQKIENGFQTILCSTQKENWNVCTNSTSQSSSQILVSYSQGNRISDRQENGSNGTGRESSSHSMNAEHNMQRKLAASNQQSVTEMMAWRTPSRSTQVHNSASLAVMTKSNLQSSNTSEKAAASGFEQRTEKYHSNKQRNRPNIAPSSFSAVSFCTNKATLQERKNASLVYQQSPMKAREAKQYSKKIIEEITYRLRSLNISNEGEATDGIDKYALVPYKEGGAMVPYETKKRKPRPKVDLDPETNRIWKLLMGKEGCEASEEENKDKEKWWEEERRVFHGRANSFIARMHLVQGDRRFSQWKGSVVDSVIGVFLTQNVSDHLSSSAFMALAAQFPLWSTTPDQTSDQSGTSILTEEPEIRGLAPVGTMRCTEKIMRQPFYNQTSETYLESPGTGRVILPTDTNGVSDENGSSSQNSSDSFVLHINGEIQSSSGSNSEAEDSGQVGKSIKNNGLSTVQHTNRTTTFQVLESSDNESLCFDNMFTHFYKQSEEVDYSKQIPGSDMFNNLEGFSTLTHPVNSSISNMQKPTMPPSYFQLHMAPHIARQEVDCFEISREECISSFPSSTSGRTKGQGTDYTSNRVGHTTEKTSGTLFQQNGLPKSQMGNTGLFAFLTKHLTDPKSKLEPVPQIGKDQLSLNNHQLERSWIFESENTVFEKPGGPIEPVIPRKSGSRDQVPNVAKHTGLGIEARTTAANKQIFLEEKITDGHAKGQEYVSSETITGIGTNTLNTRSGKQEKEKRESFDWDSLRKQVQPNGKRKERSKDTSDSMDYEAMRCADVNEISNSIKIRGMNNMLAERIKDFLNRLVREHESIDLEWLKDVPPDKAKDYLLSIWGLGLKSVECVRLLTLHHLAFPVDTNVGRIAVRLGWVPLQPLPESLQLHLLELYPVLESVQKYLWPRLCKLDQRTLYELHYQLITFGKVFCTKSKPNCNACPMRGECRHFASAFASARLALPGPEEKSIVSSAMPIATDRKAAVSIKPMLLQPSGSNGEKELMVSRCEPIIEEPATPEPEPEIAEITETDIEDAFYEDPDEIPTIKLNVEQLAVNLRNFMEEHTDLQESDMSKALVALTPEAASIPAPKLKYVVRLRTERQVYILPDTHPLLNGLDKREKDDPSPYLLALLAPGEASSSAQPPERWYKSSETGELCKEKACSSFNNMAEANSQIVRGTLLIPCRTAMKGSFPLNGTYFQVNEVFADHESSIHPIDVPRAWLWHLETRTVFFGTSATTIFRGMTTKEIQNSFWRGFVCVRGFDREKRAPRPLNRNLHIPASKPVKTNNAAEQKDQSDKPINF